MVDYPKGTNESSGGLMRMSAGFPRVHKNQTRTPQALIKNMTSLE